MRRKSATARALTLTHIWGPPGWGHEFRALEHEHEIVPTLPNCGPAGTAVIFAGDISALPSNSQPELSWRQFLGLARVVLGGPSHREYPQLGDHALQHRRLLLRATGIGLAVDSLAQYQQTNGGHGNHCSQPVDVRGVIQLRGFQAAPGASTGDSPPRMCVSDYGNSIHQSNRDRALEVLEGGGLSLCRRSVRGGIRLCLM